MQSFKTEQEAFWAGEFGDSYIERNQEDRFVASNVMMFAKMLEKAHDTQTILEFGANIGLNLEALHRLLGDVNLAAIEINPKAASILKEKNLEHVYNTSILDYEVDFQRDLVFTKGVLIHISPEALPQVYEKLYLASSKYILMCEYHNPYPIEIPYRGHSRKLFKRDFAGELMDIYSDVKLVDYGFFYSRDPRHWQEDMNWFLMEKRS
jgi:pseudaminic acid biosynthesis-associated methylase